MTNSPKVLENWKRLKKGLLNDNNLLKKLSNNLDGMRIVVHAGYTHWFRRDLKRKLPSITQSCQELRDEYASGQFGQEQLLFAVWEIYSSYIELVKTYQAIVEYYDIK